MAIFNRKYIKVPIIALIVVSLLLQFFPAPKKAQAFDVVESAKSLLRKIQQIIEGMVRAIPEFSISGAGLTCKGADRISFFGIDCCKLGDLGIRCWWLDDNPFSRFSFRTDSAGDIEIDLGFLGTLTLPNPFGRLDEERADKVAKPEGLEICRWRIPTGENAITEEDVEKFCIEECEGADATETTCDACKGEKVLEHRRKVQQACAELRRIERTAARLTYFAKQIYLKTDPLKECLFLRNCRTVCQFAFGTYSFNFNAMDLLSLILPIGWLTKLNEILTVIVNIGKTLQTLRTILELISAVRAFATTIGSTIQDAMSALKTLTRGSVARWFDADTWEEFPDNLINFQLTKNRALARIDATNERLKEIEVEILSQAGISEDNPEWKKLMIIFEAYSNDFRNFSSLETPDLDFIKNEIKAIAQAIKEAAEFAAEKNNTDDRREPPQPQLSDNHFEEIILGRRGPAPGFISENGLLQAKEALDKVRGLEVAIVVEAEKLEQQDTLDVLKKADGVTDTGVYEIKETWRMPWPPTRFGVMRESLERIEEIRLSSEDILPELEEIKDIEAALAKNAEERYFSPETYEKALEDDDYPDCEGGVGCSDTDPELVECKDLCNDNGQPCDNDEEDCKDYCNNYPIEDKYDCRSACVLFLLDEPYLACGNYCNNRCDSSSCSVSRCKSACDEGERTCEDICREDCEDTCGFREGMCSQGFNVCKDKCDDSTSKLWYQDEINCIKACGSSNTRSDCFKACDEFDNQEAEWRCEEECHNTCNPSCGESICKDACEKGLQRAVDWCRAVYCVDKCQNGGGKAECTEESCKDCWRDKQDALANQAEFKAILDPFSTQADSIRKYITLHSTEPGSCETAYGYVPSYSRFFDLEFEIKGGFLDNLDCFEKVIGRERGWPYPARIEFYFDEWKIYLEILEELAEVEEKLAIIKESLTELEPLIDVPPGKEGDLEFGDIFKTPYDFIDDLVEKIVRGGREAIKILDLVETGVTHEKHFGEMADDELKACIECLREAPYENKIDACNSETGVWQKVCKFAARPYADYICSNDLDKVNVCPDLFELKERYIGKTTSILDALSNIVETGEGLDQDFDKHDVTPEEIFAEYEDAELPPWFHKFLELVFKAREAKWDMLDVQSSEKELSTAPLQVYDEDTSGNACPRWCEEFCGKEYCQSSGLEGSKPDPAFCSNCGWDQEGVVCSCWRHLNHGELVRLLEEMVEKVLMVKEKLEDASKKIGEIESLEQVLPLAPPNPLKDVSIVTNTYCRNKCIAVAGGATSGPTFDLCYDTCLKLNPGIAMNDIARKIQEMNWTVAFSDTLTAGIKYNARNLGLLKTKIQQELGKVQGLIADLNDIIGLDITSTLPENISAALAGKNREALEATAELIKNRTAILKGEEIEGGAKPDTVVTLSFETETFIKKIMDAFSIIIGIRDTTAVYRALGGGISEALEAILDAWEKVKQIPKTLREIWKDGDAADAAGESDVPSADGGFISCKSAAAVGVDGTTGPQGGKVCPAIGQYTKMVNSQFASIRQSLLNIELVRRVKKLPSVSEFLNNLLKEEQEIEVAGIEGKVKIKEPGDILYYEQVEETEALEDVYARASEIADKTRVLWGLNMAMSMADDKCTCGWSFCKLPVCISGLPLTPQAINSYCLIVYILRLPIWHRAMSIETFLEREIEIDKPSAGTPGEVFDMTFRFYASDAPKRFLPGVAFTLTNESGDSYFCRSDGMGVCEFEGLPSGDYKFTAEGSGYYRAGSFNIEKLVEELAAKGYKVNTMTLDPAP